MKSSQSTGAQLFLLLLLAGALIPHGVAAQVNPDASAVPPDQAIAIIRGIRVVAAKDGPAVEISASRPLAASAQKLDRPPRLVIDLFNTSYSLTRKRFAVSSDQVSAVRVDQYQNTPPITRVVVDLLQPSEYRLDNARNRLTIRLTAAAGTASHSVPPTVPAFTAGVEPAVIPVSPRASSSVMLAGGRIAAGSSVTAGADTAILHLQRGGEVRVCPGTTVSVTSSQNGRELMLGMSTGSLEEHYALGSSSDSLLTPDFRILLSGPGEFHYAFHVDARGNTCVQALPGNTVSVIVSELLGEGTYQVKPTEQVVFRAGRVSLPDASAPGDCSCPAPVPVMRGSAAPTSVISDADVEGPIRLAQAGDHQKSASPRESNSPTDAATPPPALALSMASPETVTLPPSKPNDVHVHVDAPLVFRGANPAPVIDSGDLPLAYSAGPAPVPAVALPPAKTQRRGFLGKLKGLFAGMFS